MPAEYAPEHAVQHREERTMRAEMGERRGGGPLVDREVAAPEARVREGLCLEPVVDGVVDDAGNLIEERASEETVKEEADLDGGKRREPRGPDLVPHEDHVAYIIARCPTAPASCAPSGGGTSRRWSSTASSAVESSACRPCWRG